ncbi:MAG: tRNA lysidine(34) synthetase TilS [Proteobacteria bacterium]|nr:tRNA lysidine(34) synthetase TilS [Pseudomonadota bacterium]MCL2306999.1 tRNA lysidine(34) synthetase TilS [Pseudomonadota bacterium]
MSPIERALLSFQQTEAPSSLLVAFSGGLDSVVLLDALHRLREKMPHITALSAAHVHHGLSPNADAWLTFCERFCAERAIAFTARRLTLPQKPQTSLEETARQARRAALRDMADEMRADTIVLAHHQDDQAETLLLQLLRGAGPQGLAAMAEYSPPNVGWGKRSEPQHPANPLPHPSPTSGRGDLLKPSYAAFPSTPAPFPKGVSAKPTGVCCPQGEKGTNPAFWRPLLKLPRTALLAYAQTHTLEWIEDESNAEIGFKRNFLRHRIFPVLEEAFPAYRKTLSRAAALQAETAALLTELAETCHDIDEAKARFPLDLCWLTALPESLARHALRFAFRQAELRAPTFARLNDMLRQLRHARPDARIELRHGGQRLGVHRGKVILYTTVSPYKMLWRGEENVTLPHGVLHLKAGKETDALRDALNQGKEILIASCQHQRETLKPAANRPRRLLCDWLREAGIPHWKRDTWPRVYCDGELLFVPGIGNGWTITASPKNISRDAAKKANLGGISEAPSTNKN